MHDPSLVGAAKSKDNRVNCAGAAAALLKHLRRPRQVRSHPSEPVGR